MKHIIFLILILFITNVYYSTNIDKLTISEKGNLLLDYDAYNGKIHRFENRLIVQNLHKIEEFEIQPDGTLERIGFFENRNRNHTGFVDSNRFYS